MIERRFLRTGMPVGADEAGLFGRRLITFYPQLRALVASELGDDAALLFAEPTGGAHVGDVDWYTSADGPIHPYDEAPEEARQPARLALARLQVRLAALRDRCLASTDDAQKQVGQILREAMAPPRLDETYLVGGRMVTISWACGLDRSRGSNVIPAEPLPVEDPEVETAEQPVRIETRALPPPRIFVVAGDRWFRAALAGGGALLGISVLAAALAWMLGGQSAAASRDALRSARDDSMLLQQKLIDLQLGLVTKRNSCEGHPTICVPDTLASLKGEWTNEDPETIVLEEDFKAYDDITLFHRVQFEGANGGTLFIDVHDKKTGGKELCQAPLRLISFVPRSSFVFETEGDIKCGDPVPVALQVPVPLISRETVSCWQQKGVTLCDITSGTEKRIKGEKFKQTSGEAMICSRK